MQSLPLRLRAGSKPLYLRIADAVRDAIKSQLVKSGELLPSTRMLAEQFGAHRHTVRIALEELVAEGWIVGQVRSRYRVSGQALLAQTIESPSPQPRRGARALKPVRTIKSALDDEVDARFDFRSGLSDLREFPVAEYYSHVRASLKRIGRPLLAYGDPQGHARLLKQLEIYLRHARSVAGRGLIMTHGSQEGIFLAAQSFIKPGDNVVVEALGYAPAIEAFKMAGAVIQPVSVDKEGMNCAELEKILRRKRVAMIYSTPLHQYPTTVTLSQERRQHLYALASKYRIPILEDDYDHEFHYRCQPIAPLAANDPEELVIYVSSMSKVLLPSIRLGFLAVPQHLTNHFVDLRRVTTRQNDLLVQETVARWMDDGGFERHLRRMRRLYERRRDAMAQELRELQDEGVPWSFELPEGGMVTWLDTGTDSAILAKKAAKLGIALDPETRFRLDGGKGRHLRLGFTKHTEDETRKGLRQLASLIR